MSCSRPAEYTLRWHSTAKPSKPSRAYIHVTQQAFVTALGDHIRDSTFHDAAKSFQDPALLGPPALEFAPYPKIPGGRRRNDARQGTIDQDPEFKEFLASLTAPITKPAAPEGEDQKEEKVKTTPLIEALREKKANKEKPQKKGRGEHKDDATEKKILAKPGKENAGGEKSRRTTKAEKERAQKEAVKALNKEASALKQHASSAATDKAAVGASSAAPERKRGNVSIAKSMLQRDLGIGPAPNRRRGTKREVASATPEAAPQQDDNASSKQKAKEPVSAPVAAVVTSEKATLSSPKKERPSRAERRAFKAEKLNAKAGGEDSKSTAKPGPPIILKKPSGAQNQSNASQKGHAASRAPPTEPAAARNTQNVAQNAPIKGEASPVPRPANPTPSHSAAPPAPAPMGKQAFLKHANASQGITEPLIEEALKEFGAIEKVEIDKRKGFAYVDFADSDGLRKAVAKGTVKVAQGAVQVLERKEKVSRNRANFPGPPSGPPRGRGGFASRGRGGRGGGRGGGQVAASSGSDVATAPAPAPAAIASAPAAGVAT